MTFVQARKWFEDHQGALIRSKDMRSTRAVELYEMLNGRLATLLSNDIADVMRNEFVQVMLDLRELHGVNSAPS